MYCDIQAKTKSLYIHWPFCPYRCHYCPFVALSGHDSFMERYHRALVQEIQHFGKNYDQKLSLDTIYFGGGTPSTYPDKLLLDMFAILKSIFICNDRTEITLEVNPGTVRPEQLPFWRDLGINRMSIGVQSLNDSVLHAINRLQKSADVYALLEKAPLYFNNISVDIILGLPGVSVAEWKLLLSTIVAWDITHISMYVLEVHDTTPLYFSVLSKKVILPCDDEVVDLYYWSRDFLAQHGFEQYEISSFARNGYRSRHNQTYWERNPYKGFGLGACSFDGTSRFQNEKNLVRYLEAAESDQFMPFFEEAVTAEQIFSEKIMLGLRRVEGVKKDEVIAHLTNAQKDTFIAQVEVLKTEKLLIERDGQLRLTPAGLIVENEIITRLSL